MFIFFYPVAFFIRKKQTKFGVYRKRIHYEAFKLLLMLVLCLAGEVEAQLGYFSIAAFKELVYAPGDDIFVNLDLDSFVLVLLYLLEVRFDVYFHLLLCGLKSW